MIYIKDTPTMGCFLFASRKVSMKIKDLEKMVIGSLPITDGKKSVLQRRVNKLKRDPKGFLKGSYEKRSEQIVEKSPIKYRGHNNFTVLSAVYNVDKYLDDYFESLVNQSLSFKKNIQIIIVDDGSTDRSAEIIKKWQKKYPKNVRYFYKKNGGQSSARNLGMQYVDTEWVTFIDPDDFVSKNYFKTVDDKIEKDDSINMVVTNLKFYIEDENLVQDKHSLKFRFKNRVEKLPNSDLKDFINLSAAATFFKRSYIIQNNIEFNENIKPNFEDGKLIADYLMVSIGQVAFLRDAVYFYRKRSDKSSTVDNSWISEKKYNDVLKHGYIPMLKSYSNFLGRVPLHIQRTVLYDISWYVRLLVDNPEKINFLTSCQKKNFYDLIIEIFEYIDENTIFNFNLAGLWFAPKVGILGAFKNEKNTNHIVYIENIDREKRQILVSYFTYFDIPYSFRINDKDIIPKYEKIIHHQFVDRFFVKESRCWIPFGSIENNENFTVELNEQPATIALKKEQYIRGVNISKILNSFDYSSKYNTDGSWLLMDKVNKADDNAEHFYRYIALNHPDIKCYFALDRNSVDWNRLELEGFNLLEYGTKNFEHHLRKASKIISSYFDSYISNYFNDNYEYSKKFVFLQHGVIHTDLSKWLNDKPNMLGFITTTFDEYEAIVSEESFYQVGPKEVLLTGLPRHDKLLANCQYENNILLIMPTWRASIVGEVIGKTNVRMKNKDFMETQYAQCWYKFLHSEIFKKIVEKYDYKVIFAPHSNIQPYIDEFNLPSYINVWEASSTTTSMQELFQEAKFMITDYSSVAFEMAVLNKTTLYYQFDKDEIFSGSHTIQEGYFDYEEDGFGPVATKESELLFELEKVLKNNGNPLEPYKKRMIKTFPFRDGKNCERVYEAIIDLDRPDTSEVSIEKIMEYAQQAMKYDAWDLALERIENALQHPAITPIQIEEITKTKEDVIQTGYQDEPIKLANILWHEKRLSEALEQLKQVDNAELTDELLRLRVKLAILNNDFKLARNSQKLLLESYNESCTIEDWQFYTQLATI